jgi:hypothetical protein
MTIEEAVANFLQRQLTLGRTWDQAMADLAQELNRALQTASATIGAGASRAAGTPRGQHVITVEPVAGSAGPSNQWNVPGSSGT